LDAVEVALRENVAAVVHYAPALHGADDLQDKAASIGAGIEAMEDGLANLLRELEAGGPSAALGVRIRETEAAIEAAKAEEAEMWRRVSAVQGPLVERRLADLEAALSAEPFDVGRANVALRQTLSGVTVNYLTGELEFEWVHGGSSRLLFAWPEMERAA
jgi:hypothetical protein